MKTSSYSSQSPTKLDQINRLIFVTASVLAMLVLSATSASAFTNYLANPGFETGAQAPWLDTYNPSHSVDNTNGWVYGSGNTIHEPAHGGRWAMKEWGCYWGNFVQTHTISQYIPTAPNSVWSADVWAYTATPDNLKGQNYALLQVTFCDALSNQLAIAYSAVVDTNAPVNTWLHLAATNSADGTTNLTAPDGTAFVRFGLFLSQDAVQSGGSVYWDDANLIRTAAPDPEISSSPQNLTVIYGQTATFSVLASGNTPLTYIWQKDGITVTNDTRISGATTATLAISNAATADQAFYSVTVTNEAGSLTSPSSGYLTVLDPGILTNPVSLQKVEGQSATFTVVAAGSGTVTYAWYNTAGPLSNGGRISGADSATLTISNLTVADGDNYYVIVTGAGQATSTAASLYVRTVAQASNLIRNGGFESGMAYWTAWNGYAAVAAPAGTETNYDGSQIGEVWGTGNGTWNGMNQSSATTTGYVYRADAWFLVSAGAPITGSSTAWLEINFYNNQGTVIGNFPSPIISSNSVVGLWTNVTVPYAVAPAGATETRCQINYHAGDGGGAIYVDDVSFWLRIPVTITASVSGTNLVLSFPTQIGVTNQILYKDDLGDANWQVLQTVTGDLSGQATVPTPRSTAKRFYRVNTL